MNEQILKELQEEIDDNNLYALECYKNMEDGENITVTVDLLDVLEWCYEIIKKIKNY